MRNGWLRLNKLFGSAQNWWDVAAFGPLLPQPLPLPLWWAEVEQALACCAHIARRNTSERSTQAKSLRYGWAREGLLDVRSSKRRFFTRRSSFECVAPGRANSSPHKKLPRLACTAAERVQRRRSNAIFDYPRRSSARGSPSSLAHLSGRGKRGRPPQAAWVVEEGIERQTRPTAFERHPVVY